MIAKAGIQAQQQGQPEELFLLEMNLVAPSASPLINEILQ